MISPLSLWHTDATHRRLYGVQEKRRAEEVTQEADKPKHPGGRPRLFPSVEYLQERIDAYFAYADNPENPKPYTMAGLAYFLDIDRKTLTNYTQKDEFFPALKKARVRIEMSKAEKLESKDYSTAGLIFDLVNNHDYVQKVETDHKSSDGSMTPKSDDALRASVIAALQGKHGDANA